MLLQMVVEMNVSFRSLIECETLRRFLSQTLGWTMPSRWTLTRLLPQYYNYLLEQLGTTLRFVESISVTTDSTFLTRQQVPYICITGHWIDDSWKLHSTVLAVFLAEQSETADFIVRRLRDVLETRLGLGRKIHCITTDEGQNFLSAAQHLKQAETVRESMRCACHRLQLMVKKAYMHNDCRQFRLLLNKCCAVVHEFKNGWQSSKRNILHRHQEEYVQRLAAQAAKLETEAAAHSTRAAQDAVREHHDRLAEAQDQLSAELSTSTHYERRSIRVRDEVKELAAVPSLDLNSADNSDSDDDFDMEEKYDTEAEEAAMAQAAQLATDAAQLTAFVRFIFNKRSLIQRAMTRWLTYVNVVLRVIIWREPLMSALDEIARQRHVAGNDLQRDALRISQDEVNILQQFMVIGRACKQILELLEGDKHITISALLFSHHRLVRFFNQAAASPGVHDWIKAFCERAVQGASIKFNAGVDKAAMIGTILDPRFKSLSFLPGPEAGKCRDALVAAYTDLTLHMGESVLPADSDAGHRRKRQRVNAPSVFSDFSGDILESTSPTKGATKTEIERYLEHPSEDAKSDPLDWWRVNAVRYPKLAILARRYLAIPASSASSERLFSRSKMTATAARQGLSAETLCMLLFVSRHQEQLPIY